MLKEFRKTQGKHFVCFIVADAVSKLKIGITKDATRRLSNIRCGSPCPLYLAAFIEIDGGTSAAAKTEQKFHEWFSAHHSHREWFEWNKETQSLVEECVLSEAILSSNIVGELDLRALFGERYENLVSF